MIKKIFILFIFIFFINITSSITLSMGPPQLDFIGDSNETICQSATIKYNGTETLIGKILFAEEGYYERELNMHNLNASELGLNVTIPKKIIINNYQEIEICVNGESGDYHGILLYKIKDKPIQIGIWINISLSGSETISITNIAKEKIERTNSKNVFSFTPVLLGVILFFLIIIARYRL